MKGPLYPCMAATKVWVVRFLASRGILEGETRAVFNSTQRNMRSHHHVTLRGPRGNAYTTYLCLNKDFFLSLEEAQEAATKIVSRKIVSLKKQLKRLTELTFT